uniref:F-box only protein 41-like n=1 Tax=Myxine glutinosa TaxID=7769 RepID=UPI00358E4EFA
MRAELVLWEDEKMSNGEEPPEPQEGPTSGNPRIEAELEATRARVHHLEAERLELSRQTELLSTELARAEHLLRQKEQEAVSLTSFLHSTAEREARAKAELQDFIEGLIERAERAEQALGRLPPGPQQVSSLTLPSPAREVAPAARLRREWQRQHRGQSSGESSGFLSAAEAGGSRGPHKPGTDCRINQGLAGNGDASGDGRYSLQCLESGGLDWGEHPDYLPGSPSVETESEDASTEFTCSALACVFSYLDTRSLLKAAEVCKAWRRVARDPTLWTRVVLENARVASKFLHTLSQWCVLTRILILHNLRPRAKQKAESREEYARCTRTCLEEGLESVLKAAGPHLRVLRVSDCPGALTARVLWLAGCHCRRLQAFTYRSTAEPVSPEAIWSLGAGSSELISLQVTPTYPCQQDSTSMKTTLRMIGRCFPNLQGLGVGGPGCDAEGLAAIARSCPELRALELDHVKEVGCGVAEMICNWGLRRLEVLAFVFTPVTPRALQHFAACCPLLKSILVHVGISDYFEDVESLLSQRLYEQLISKLQALKALPEFSDILHIKAGYG